MHEASRGLSATAELLVIFWQVLEVNVSLQEYYDVTVQPIHRPTKKLQNGCVADRNTAQY